MTSTKVIAIANVRNHNNRIYPKNELEKLVGKTYYGHFSESFTGIDYSVPNMRVDLTKTCIEVSNIRFDDDKLIGDVKFLDTPYGEILKSITEFDLSMILMGNVSNEGNVYIREVYRIDAIQATKSSFEGL